MHLWELYNFNYGILVLCKVKNYVRMKTTLLIDTIDTTDTFTYKLIIIYKNVKIAAKRKFSTNFRLLHALENWIVQIVRKPLLYFSKSRFSYAYSYMI